MRLLSLEIENFRTHSQTAIDLSDVTVFIGPNDTGKSSILDAVRFLLSGTDRDGKPWTRTNVAGRSWFDPANADVDWPPESTDADPERPVTVVGVLSDLLPSERELFEPLVADGIFRIGAYCPGVSDADDDPRRVGPCWVVDEDRIAPDVANAEHGYWRHGGRLWRSWYGRSIEGWEFMLLMRANHGLPQVVGLSGPDEAPKPAATFLEPFVERQVGQLVAALPEQLKSALNDLADQVSYDLSDKLSALVPRYVSGTRAAVAHRRAEGRLQEAMRTLIGDLDVYVGRNAATANVWDREQSVLPPGSERVDTVGAGARRGVALSILELYADDAAWPADLPVTLLLEEPETGLHPSAQRRVARALQGLRDRTGVQALIVSHSPIFIDAAADAIRLVQRDPREGSRVSVPDLAELVAVMGARPSDVLLGAGFVVVEGSSDQAILETWARRLGTSFEKAQVRLLPAGGWTKVAAVAKLLSVVYPGAWIAVVMDAGADGLKERRRIASRWGDRIMVEQLSEAEIEWFLSPRAVVAWLASQGADPHLADRFPARSGEHPSAKRQLSAITNAAFGRDYRELEDGRAIAGLMTEGDLAPSIQEVLLRLARLAEGDVAASQL